MQEICSYTKITTIDASSHNPPPKAWLIPTLFPILWQKMVYFHSVKSCWKLKRSSTIIKSEVLFLPRWCYFVVYGMCNILGMLYINYIWCAIKFGWLSMVIPSKVVYISKSSFITKKITKMLTFIAAKYSWFTVKLCICKDTQKEYTSAHLRDNVKSSGKFTILSSFKIAWPPPSPCYFKHRMSPTRYYDTRYLLNDT